MTASRDVEGRDRLTSRGVIIHVLLPHRSEGTPASKGSGVEAASTGCQGDEIGVGLESGMPVRRGAGVKVGTGARA